MVIFYLHGLDNNVGDVLMVGEGQLVIKAHFLNTP